MRISNSNSRNNSRLMSTHSQTCSFIKKLRGIHRLRKPWRKHRLRLRRRLKPRPMRRRRPRLRPRPRPRLKLKLKPRLRLKQLKEGMVVTRLSMGKAEDKEVVMLLGRRVYLCEYFAFPVGLYDQISVWCRMYYIA